MHSRIPHDIWALIAHFISPLCLKDLFTVNSTFFDLAMDCRYRQISFAYLDDRTLRSLSRLKDPLVAKRVRVLHVYPGFLQQLLQKGEKEKEVPKLPSRTSLRLLLSDMLTNQIRVYKRKKNQDQMAHILKSSQDIIAALLDVLGRLHNVTDYHIMWCGLPPILTSPVPFLTAALQSSLRKLSLEISLENIETLLGPAFSTPKLEELDLMVRVDGIRSTFHQQRIMLDHLGPAINGLNSTLRTLSIQAWEPLDLSPLFRSIQQVPDLSSLSIAIPIDDPHLGDPNGLSGFLNLHSRTLQELTLKCTRYAGIGLQRDCSSTLEDWIFDVFSKVNLGVLMKLEISSSLFPIESSMMCLEHLAAPLRTLSMTGRHYSLKDVEEILRILSLQRRTGADTMGRISPTSTCWSDVDGSDGLKIFRLGPVTLTPELMDHLAVMLPQLSKLELFVKDVECREINDDEWTDDGKELDIWSEGGHEVYDHLNHVANFCDAMEERLYDDWRLRSLSITLPSILHPETQCESDLKQSIAHAIPTLMHRS